MNMIKQLIVFSLLFCSYLTAQTYTSVTGTVSDTSPQVWAFATVSAQLVAPFGVPGPLLNDGHPIPIMSYVTVADASSNFAFTLDSNSHIAPANSFWNITVCPNATSTCSTFKSTIIGATQVLTFSVTPSVSVNATSAINRAYVDTEVNGGNGSLYWRTSDNTLRGCQATPTGVCTWVPIGSGGGGGNISPGTNPSQYPVWSPGSSTWNPQNKASYDVRDWTTCNTPIGTNIGADATSGIANMLAAIGSQQAIVRVIGSTNPSDTCLVDTISWPPNITLDFSGGGAFTLSTVIVAPGGGAVDGVVQGSFNTSTASCSVTINVPTTGDAIVLMTNFRFGGGGLGLPFDTKNNVYRLVSASNADPNHFSSNTFGWVASNVSSGSITITVPYLSAPPANSCGAFAVSGLGPSVGADGVGASCGLSACNNNSPMSTIVSATYTAGSFIVAFGGNNAETETCTAGGAFTQILNIGVNMNLCAQVIASTAGGPIVATQAINNVPLVGQPYWMYNSFGLKPVLATLFIQGGVIDPNLHQIFYTINPGTVDFTGTTILDKIYPEWFGAGTNVSATINTNALQVAINAAIGIGRTNGSGLTVYNRPLYLTGRYSINNELKMYDALNFRIDGAGRLSSGIIQTATNKRIIDGQCVAYGEFSNMSFSSTATQDTVHPLVDIDKNAITCPNDLAPQFIEFYTVGFNGNGVTATGALFAKSGGGAQSSNIYCYDCNGLGFTTAAWQIGEPTALAQNALAITWYGGDIQGSPQYGIANYGGGFITMFGTSFENGYTIQTGADVYSQDSQGTMTLYNIRSESRKLCWCANGRIYNTQLIDQDQHTTPGNSAPVGAMFTGNQIAGDGAHYQVTIDGGPFSGFGTTTSTVLASGGSSSTLVDTNQTIAGSVTIKLFNVSTLTPETVTQAVTGATGTLLNNPASTATVTGSVGTPTCTFNEIMTQSVTGVTATEQAPSPSAGSNSPLFLNNLSGTADNTHVWNGGSSGCVYTPTAAPTFSVSSPLMLITTVVGSPDNTHDWVGGVSGAHYTPTAVPAGTNWTVNTFAGQQVSIFTGTNARCYATIASNTATTLTITPPWVTQYAYTICTAPDSTSTFDIEPTWNHGTVVSGGMTLQYLNEFVLAGGSDTNVFTGEIQNSIIPGLYTIWSNPGANIILKSVFTNRVDWFSLGGVGGNQPQVSPPSMRDWDVRVLLPGGNIPVPYTWPTVGSAGVQINTPLQEDLGTKMLCWTTGTVGLNTPLPSNTSASPTCIGNRSDPGAANDPTRNILEYVGFLGRAAAQPALSNNFNPIDIGGTDTDFTGGPSTGAGVGGGINFWTSNPSASSSNINSGKLRARIEPNGLFSNTDGFFGSKRSEGPSPCATSYGITTLSVGSTTTDTALTCLPANSIIDAVVYRITTTITTAANFTIGDATTAARFCSTQSTLTAGTTGTCFVQADQTGAAGPRQVGATSVRITTNVNPGAGAIRLIVYYHTWTPPTS